MSDTGALDSRITLDSYDLAAAEKLLCERALQLGGNIVTAAKLLGITRHSLKRRIIKHHIKGVKDLG